MSAAVGGGAAAGSAALHVQNFYAAGRAQGRGAAHPAIRGKLKEDASVGSVSGEVKSAVTRNQFAFGLT